MENIFMTCVKCKERREAARKALIGSALGVQSAVVAVAKTVAKAVTKKPRTAVKPDE